MTVSKPLPSLPVCPLFTLVFLERKAVHPECAHKVGALGEGVLKSEGLEESAIVLEAEIG